MSGIGFDFGTTNSLIAAVHGERAVTYLDGNQPFPSVVCYEGTRKVIGRDAKERLGEAGLGIHGNTVRSPKRLLGNESVFLEGVQRSPVDIVADLVSYIRDQVAPVYAHDSQKEIMNVVVTLPVNMEGRRRRALRDAFSKAGLGIVQFIHEPFAALYAYFKSAADRADMIRRFERQYMLVFDWGGGTLDLTLCRLADGMLYQLENDGTDDVGGDLFDDAIKNEVLRKVQVAKFQDKNVEIHPDALSRLLHRCELAKIELSLRREVSIYVDNFFRGVSDPSFDYKLTRHDMDEIVAMLLNKGFERIERVIDKAGVSNAQIALCLATGGMVNMPAIKERLHEWFGAQRVHISDKSATLVAEGAAWVAHDGAKLCLAKNVELLLARNSHMTLLPAGSIMPVMGQVQKDAWNLYCVDPRDGFAKFQLQTPVRPGIVMENDNRTPLANLVVKVDQKALPFRERLELSLTIDDNLILSATAQSLNAGGKDYAEVHELKFGLALEAVGSKTAGEDNQMDLPKLTNPREPGALLMRSNIADKESESLVPGEFILTYNPTYMDARCNPPLLQVDEMLYYAPCSVCGRKFNDAECQCDTFSVGL